MPHFQFNVKPLARLSTAISLTALLGCYGGSSGIGSNGLPDPGLTRVQTENTTAREATISEEGGSLTVTDSKGIIYTLAVPESALTKETTIGMFPVTGVTTLPTDAQVAGGVHFVPEGLVLQIGATLTMEFPPGVDLLTLFAVTYNADGANSTLGVSRADGQKLTVQVQHFSGTIAVSGTEALSALGFEATEGGVPEGFIDRIAQASQGFSADDPAATAAVLPIYVEWYNTLVRPTLEFATATTTTLDSGSFDEARRVYEEWRSVASMTGILPQLSAQVSDALPLLAAYLNKRYDFFNQACASAQNLGFGLTESFGPIAQAADALNVGTLAREWGVPLKSNNLDDEFLLDNLCVKVAFDTLLPTGLDRPGDTGTLTVGTHFTIAGGPARNDMPIRVRLKRNGTAFGNPSSGLVDSAGFLESDVTWPEGVDPLTIDVLAQLDQSGFRKIARFDRVTIGCTPPVVTAVTPSGGGRSNPGVFHADVAGNPTSFTWDFGGGASPNTSTVAEPAVTFSSTTGTFTGSLTVANECATASVFFFIYEVRAVSLTSQTFLGDMNDQEPFFHIDCSGAARASFSFDTSSGLPTFQIEQLFDCDARSQGTFVFFQIDSPAEAEFVTRDGLGSGSVTGDHLSFQHTDGDSVVTFEGDLAP